MPKRVLDGEGFWGSRKLRRCPLWIRKEYAYLYALADCNGSFELDLPVILGKVKPNRPDLSWRKLDLIFRTFNEEGIAFVWTESGRHFAHWTGSERRGRLPRPSRRSNKYEKKLAPPIPRRAYKAYLRRFGETLKASASDDLALATATATATDKATEEPTAQALPSLGFDKFWEAYPRGSADFPRRVGKPVAQRAWKKSAAWQKSEKIIEAVERWKQTEQWQKEGGKFIPHPAKFLNQRRWEDEPPETSTAGGESGVGRGPRTEGKFGKCSDCGLPTAPGFTKCYPCTTKKAPVNP